MTREDVTKQFPEATKAQIDALLNIHSADIGRARGDAVKRAAPWKGTEPSSEPPAQTPVPAEVPAEEPQMAESCEEQTEVESDAAAEPAAQEEEQTEVYDFDKPYESQFAKDLAALKARQAEAEEAGQTDAQ